jgi:hypothetical protein
VSAAGSGAALPEPVLGDRLMAPVVVQLHTSAGPTCWQSRFESTDITRNDGLQLKAKAVE